MTRATKHDPNKKDSKYVHIGSENKGAFVDRDWWESLSSKSKEQELRHLERTTIVEEDRDDRS